MQAASTESPTRIVVCDDHALVREGLRRILADQVQLVIVGEAADGKQALELVRRLEPDVLLLDISLPKMDGIATTRAIMTSRLPTRVLVLTMHTEDHYALRALRAGAVGFVAKDASTEELVAAIEHVHRGQRYLPADLERRFAERYLSPESQLSGHGLSRRELEVLCLLARGQTNREIADKLSISIKTVDSHRGHILKKLNLRNNADLTRFAIQQGYVEV